LEAKSYKQYFFGILVLDPLDGTRHIILTYEGEPPVLLPPRLRRQLPRGLEGVPAPAQLRRPALRDLPGRGTLVEALRKEEIKIVAHHILGL